MTTLIIARHGNTFDKGETPTRCGLHTDLPLVEKGKAQAKALGTALKLYGLTPDDVYASTLIRTQDTAKMACEAMDITRDIKTSTLFDEIDYGPDENKIEADVISRIGAHAIQAWDERAIVPNGWIVNPDQIIAGWKEFADSLKADTTTLVVTSNGTARFAPHITGDFEAFRAAHNIKLATGAYGVLKYDGAEWSIENWNVKP